MNRAMQMRKYRKRMSGKRWKRIVSDSLPLLAGKRFKFGCEKGVSSNG